MRLEAITCESCNRPLESDEFEPDPRGSAPTAHNFDSCLRRCTKCRIGYSNSRANPTSIYGEPALGVPAEVRAGVMPTLEQALNELNRPSKKVKFGFSTSEDAVTWTVFQAIAGAQRLGTIVCKATGKEPSSAVNMLLWGVQQPISSATSLVRNQIIDVLTALGELRTAFSEPDVVISCKEALVFVEAKYLSGNDYATASDKPWNLYLDSPAFSAPELVRESGLYELARNWRLAWELSQGRACALVNLGQPGTLKRDEARLRDFEAGLNCGACCRFLKWTWADLMSVLTEPPAWLRSYVSKRRIDAVSGT